MAERAVWATPKDIEDQFGSIDFVADNRAIFNIGGNRFRLVVHVSYEFKSVLVKFVGTHAEYDRIDPVTCKVR
jgi:mRNA interferase HigB